MENKAKLNFRLIILCLVTFCVLAIFVIVKQHLNIDNIFYNDLVLPIQTINLTKLLKGVTYLGSGYVVACLCFLWLALIKDRKEKYLILTIIIFFVIINAIIKLIVCRNRPDVAIIYEDGFSFPSGHALCSMVFYGIFLSWALTKLKHGKLKIILSIIVVIIITMVGFSRIYLGVHYFSDVLAGYILGMVGVLSYNYVKCYLY